MAIFHLHNLAMGDVVPLPPTAGTSSPPLTGIPTPGTGRSTTSTLRGDIIDALRANGWQRPPQAPGVVRH